MKRGDVLFVKLTGEPVMVLSGDDPNIKVKRPIYTTEGVKYLVDTFEAIELESALERAKRVQSELFGQAFGNGNGPIPMAAAGDELDEEEVVELIPEKEPVVN